LIDFKQTGWKFKLSTAQPLTIVKYDGLLSYSKTNSKIEVSKFGTKLVTGILWIKEGF